MDDLDEGGYLSASDGRLATTTLCPDGGDLTVFTRRALEVALTSFGEESLVSVVQLGLRRDQVHRIGARHAALILTKDPMRRSGEALPFDRALALAAVEVLEGVARPLARNRRRASSLSRKTFGG